VSARLLALRLRGDRRGATLVEFAIVAPVFLLLLIGIMETGFAIYAKVVLNGAVAAAGRSSGLESGQLSQAAIDRRVRERVQAVVPNAAFTFTRANYQNFADIGRPEDFSDTNRNGQHDANECFSDENGNGQWDADVGRGGLGGASDVVLYVVQARYPSLLPIASAFGLPQRWSISASTILRTQPFATQSTRQAVQVCP
jgi:Flp pilus assembly protein TadG